MIRDPFDDDSKGQIPIRHVIIAAAIFLLYVATVLLLCTLGIYYGLLAGAELVDLIRKG